MISLVEVQHYRSLQYIRSELTPFQVLVGPNGSGKTSFLDVLAFISSLLSHASGLEATIAERTSNFRDLVWGRIDDSFELAVEAVIPADIRNNLEDQHFDTIRYEVGIGINFDTLQVELQHEKVMLIRRERPSVILPTYELFPSNSISLPKSGSIAYPQGTQGNYTKMIMSRQSNGESNYYPEPIKEDTDNDYKSNGKIPAFQLKHHTSSFKALPPDSTKFPVALWFKDLLTNGIQQIILNSLFIRRASPPGRGKQFLPDGSNLPWIVADLIQKHPERVQEWIRHIQTAIPDIVDIRTVEREDDKHRYLMVKYSGGFEVPSWMVSDGTLRLLALTLLAYIPDLTGMYLIEEPENGIHPRAVETVIQSLASVYNSQILLATHSPVIISTMQPEDILCFAKNNNGATEIVAGNNHPALQQWKGSPNLGNLFAGGVLGA